MDTKLTDEQQADIDARVEEFVERHHNNVKELQIDFVTFPQYVQTGPGAFSTVANIIPIDKKYAPVPSPVQQDSEGDIIVD